MKLSCRPHIALLLVLAFTPLTAGAGDGVQIAERLQRHQSAPPAEANARRNGNNPGSQGQRPEHAREPGRPGHSRQERSRDSRGNRPQHPDDRPDESFDPDSRWNTHGAPELDSGEADDDPDDGRIYFGRYP